MKTMIGIPTLKPSKLEYAIIRFEYFKREGFDKDTLQALTRYVAKTSGLSYQELVDKLRLNFVGQ